MLIAQAGRLAERHLIPSRCLPRFGTSWLCRFQERYGIKWKRPHGESGSVDLQAAATEMQRLRNLIGSYPYANVFNMDETGLFYNAVPRGSLWVNESPPQVRQGPYHAGGVHEHEGERQAPLIVYWQLGQATLDPGQARRHPVQVDKGVGVLEARLGLSGGSFALGAETGVKTT
ncbi:hypothetical protein PC128_g21378 [Phytophthora cactorum]|nr:hypothetical protein PC128_g21378 [Phytophthora cactorum]